MPYFWEEQGNLEQHRAYLERQLVDPHTLPVIGCFDGTSFGYFEIYWAKEDRIAPFYDVDNYDRGLHLLVGEEAFRGKAFYTAWFSSICHYMFLDDPRTRRIVCEPRHDNHRQIANFDRGGFAKIKHFDFPHKRALLVMLWRERFFFRASLSALVVTENNFFSPTAPGEAWPVSASRCRRSRQNNLSPLALQLHICERAPQKHRTPFPSYHKG
ncbi:GNAT family N-acetyltransferase [Azotobacter vinelandii]